MLPRLCFVDFHSWIALENVIDVHLTLVCLGWKHKHMSLQCKRTQVKVPQVTFTAVSLSRNIQFPAGIEHLDVPGDGLCLLRCLNSG